MGCSGWGRHVGAREEQARPSWLASSCRRRSSSAAEMKEIACRRAEQEPCGPQRAVVQAVQEQECNLDSSLDPSSPPHPSQSPGSPRAPLPHRPWAPPSSGGSQPLACSIRTIWGMSCCSWSCSTTTFVRSCSSSASCCCLPSSAASGFFFGRPGFFACRPVAVPAVRRGGRRENGVRACGLCCRSMIW